MTGPWLLWPWLTRDGRERRKKSMLSRAEIDIAIAIAIATVLSRHALPG